MNNLLEIFSYPFMLRALAVGIIISFCAALIGTPLVLRKNSMIGDGLSHVAFGAFALASVLGLAPLEFALPVVILASFLILRLTNRQKLHGDAAIALISASSLALGTFIVSLTGSNVDINNYLFGSILSITNFDVIFSLIFGLLVLTLFTFFYHKIFALTFDENFAKSIGLNTNLYNLIFAALCSITIVLGMRLMGSLLISSLIIFPTLSARQLAKSYKNVVISSALLSILTFTIGLITSYSLATPTGATIVLVNLLALILLTILRQISLML